MSSYVPEPAPTGGTTAYPQAPIEPTVPNRLLGVSDLIGGAFRTLRADLRLFLLVPVAVAAALVLPVLLLIGVGVATARASGGATASEVVVVLGILLALAAGVILVRVSAALVIGAYRLALGERATLRALWDETRGIIWSVIGLYLLAVAAMVVVGGLAVLLIGGAVAADEGAGIGVMLLLILGMYPVMIWLSVKLAFVFQAMAIEKAGPIEAIRRSFALTKGMWWVTLGRQLMLALLGLPMFFVLSLATAPLSTLSQDSSTGVTAAAGIGAALAMAIGVLAMYVYQLYSVCYATLMYLDARRREGVGPQAYRDPAYYGTPAQGYQQGPGYQQRPVGYPYGPAAGAGTGATWDSSLSPVPATPTPDPAPYPQHAPELREGQPVYPEAGSLWSNPTNPTSEMPGDTGGSGDGSGGESGSGDSGGSSSSD